MGQMWPRQFFFFLNVFVVPNMYLVLETGRVFMNHGPHLNRH